MCLLYHSIGYDMRCHQVLLVKGHERRLGRVMERIVPGLHQATTVILPVGDQSQAA